MRSTLQLPLQFERIFFCTQDKHQSHFQIDTYVRNIKLLFSYILNLILICAAPFLPDETRKLDSETLSLLAVSNFLHILGDDRKKSINGIAITAARIIIGCAAVTCLLSSFCCSCCLEWAPWRDLVSVEEVSEPCMLE